ncbi:substrate-binding periplasmic protein [Indioceanicola profundi]|uniref:substrate-binding periplasmic protein n=1 Tax=Indioceanicola profundi TaxID=2220096 RepID=UPI000E6AD5CE|nr:transporter substrate-binding domain-containing protein [Indioceanicola profundi]
MSVSFPRRTFLTGLGAAAAAGLQGLPPARGMVSGRRIPFGFRPADPLLMVGQDGKLSGLEYEIIVAAMAVPGHQVLPYLGPNARLTQALFRAAVDAIAPAVALGNTQFTLSDSYLTYSNVAISLARRGLSINSPADLAGYRISAFQRARQALGPDFAKAVVESDDYREEGQQHRQALALLHGRADVIVGDRRILLHYARLSMLEAGIWEEMAVHPIFPISEYAAAFREAAIAADFNRGLAAIRADGTYGSILERYATPD